jgi:hypothetical protein
MTDGLENASSEWRQPHNKALVEQQTNDHGWEFLYMGADQDPPWRSLLIPKPS